MAYDKKTEFKGIEGELLRRQLIRDYSTFVAYVNEGFCMTKFHNYLTHEIQEFLEVKTANAFDILLLSVPPRHGKSFCVTETLPAWYLGNHPGDEVIIASYQSIFAEGFNKICRDKFNRFAPAIFHATPDTSLQRAELWATSVGGRCRAAGLDAGITGYGANLFIIDDPIKNQADANSETIVSKMLAEMGPSVQSRIYPRGKLIVIQTRWIENDTIGWIKDNWGELVWKDINLPCEYDEEAAVSGPCPLGRHIGDSLMGPHLGDPILPAKIANDNDWLKSKKKVVCAAEGERVWNALYQGRPTGLSGNTFDPSWVQDFSIDDFATEAQRDILAPSEFSRRKHFEYLQISVDATFKGTVENDFVAIGVRGIYEGDVYLMRQINRRMTFTQTVERLLRLSQEFPEADELVIEDKANGPAIIDTLRYREAIKIPIVAVNPMGGKVARAEAVAPYVREGHYHIPHDLPTDELDSYAIHGEKLSGKDIILAQLKSFPYGAHDDMVDDMSQSLIRLIKLVTGETPTARRRFVRYSKWYPDMWADYEEMSDIEQQKFIAMYGAPEEWRDAI